jgi:hypothetical protein
MEMTNKTYTTAEKGMKKNKKTQDKAISEMVRRNRDDQDFVPMKNRYIWWRLSAENCG